MFTCRGCQREYKDKDKGLVLKYQLQDGTVSSLYFCWPIEQGCWIPTLYYMLNSMPSEVRKSVTNVKGEILSIMGEPVREFQLFSFERMYQHLQKAVEKTPLEKIKFKKPLEHYKKVGEALAKGDFKRTSDELGEIAQYISQSKR